MTFLTLSGYFIGTLLILVAAADAFMTILSLRGGGYLTNRWTHGLWWMALAVHRRRPIHGLLSLLGPLMTIGTVIIWYAMLLIGWTLIFLSGTAAVIENDGGGATDLWQRFYFVGTTLSGVGYGDLVPSRPPWTVLSNISAFTTTFLIATSLSYVIPVVSAGLDRRLVATNIHSVGQSPEELVRMSWTGGNSKVMNSYWMEFAAALDRHTFKHLVYPVLHFFHSQRRANSSALAILHFADAVFLIEQTANHDDRPPESFFKITRKALETYTKVKQGKTGSPDDNTSIEQSAGHLTRSLIQRIGLEPRDENRFEESLRDYLPLRAELVLLCRQDGWDPASK